MSKHPVEDFMREAIAQAFAARASGDYAIGAAVAMDGKLIALGRNRVKIDNDPTQHAEMVAIRKACRIAESRHIPGAVLYTTVEPCPMCASAAIWARMAGIVSGSTIDDMAAFRSKFGSDDWSWRTVDLAAREVLRSGEPVLFLEEGFLRDECRALFHHD
ncbi:MAG: nucleoside deaminase [Myxococcales bacterium]|nr:nucleoside deaminase [Myxococcales bacterium]